jgi:hypothetical protein
MQVWRQFGLVINCADIEPSDRFEGTTTTYLHVPLPVREISTGLRAQTLT